MSLKNIDFLQIKGNKKDQTRLEIQNKKGDVNFIFEIDKSKEGFESCLPAEVPDP